MALLIGLIVESVAALVGFLMFDVPIPFVIGGGAISLLTVWLLVGCADSQGPNASN